MMARPDRDIIIQSLGIAADHHKHDRDSWQRSGNVALQPSIDEAEAMRAECEALRDRMITEAYPALAEPQPSFTVDMCPVRFVKDGMPD